MPYTPNSFVPGVGQIDMAGNAPAPYNAAAAAEGQTPVQESGGAASGAASDSTQGASEPSVVSTEAGQSSLNDAISSHQQNVAAIQNQQNTNVKAGGAVTPATTNVPSSAAITAIQAQGGITADEASQTGVTSDMLAANYTYDTNTGYYVPKDNTTGVPAAQNQYVADQAKINAAFSNVTGGWSTTDQNLINSITAMYGSRIADQQAINANATTGMATSNMRNGTSRYAGGVASSLLTSEETSNLAKVTDIQNQMAQAISTAEDNIQKENYSEFMDNMSELDKLRSDQTTTLKDLHDQATAAATAAQAEQDKVTAAIGTVADDAAKNGAPSSVQQAIAAAKTQADAITAAGDYLQTSTDAQTNDYLMYKRDATASGQAPENFSTWKVQDDAQTAKEKEQEAYGTAFATESGKDAAAAQNAANTTQVTSPVVASTGAMSGITVNAPADVAPYVNFSANGVKYVDLSNFAGTATEKNQAVQDAQAAGYKVITNKNTALDVQNITDASTKLSDMQTAFDANNSGNAAERDSYSAAFMAMGKALQTNPNAVGTDEYQDAALDILKAISGVQGFRGGASIVEQVKSTFPQNTDTQAVVDSKIATLQKLIDDRETALVGTPSAGDQLLIQGNQAQTSLTDFVTNTPTITVNGQSTSTSGIISQALRMPGATPLSVYNAMKARGLITN